MTVPLVVLAVGAVVAGWVGHPAVLSSAPTRASATSSRRCSRPIAGRHAAEHEMAHGDRVRA